MPTPLGLSMLSSNIVESLFQIAEELERRDEDAAAALLEVERLQADVQELRGRAVAVATFLRELPPAVEARRDDADAAEAARADAETELREAKARQERARKEDERLGAARTVQQASDALREAELRLEQARREEELLARDAEERRAEAGRLETRAAELAARPPLAGVTPLPVAGGLDGVLDWSSRARGELLLARAALAGERDEVVREATELVAGVLGEPLTATSAAGVRERLARALDAG